MLSIGCPEKKKKKLDGYHWNYLKTKLLVIQLFMAK